MVLAWTESHAFNEQQHHHQSVSLRSCQACVARCENLAVDMDVDGACGYAQRRRERRLARHVEGMSGRPSRWSLPGAVHNSRGVERDVSHQAIGGQGGEGFQQQSLEQIVRLPVTLVVEELVGVLMIFSRDKVVYLRSRSRFWTASWRSPLSTIWCSFRRLQRYWACRGHKNKILGAPWSFHRSWCHFAPWNKLLACLISRNRSFMIFQRYPSWFGFRYILWRPPSSFMKLWIFRSWRGCTSTESMPHVVLMSPYLRPWRL